MTDFENVKVEDLVRIPDVKTVVHINDTLNSTLKSQLVESFVFTKEVEHSFSVFLKSISSGKGRGYFLHGNYGSGKSHFLACLSLALKDKHVFNTFAKNLGSSFLLREKVEPGNYIVVNISLVEHSNKERLEDIVLSAVSSQLKEEKGVQIQRTDNEDAYEELLEIINRRYSFHLKQFLKDQRISDEKELFTPKNSNLVDILLDELNLPYGLRFNRSKAIKQVSDAINECGAKGIVLIMDELSEFLRSKPDARTFNEDIRFLQYLAEAGADIPVWIMAAVQDKIEETGDISPELLKKINARYPVRLHLTGQHVKELIDRRLIIKKSGSEEYIQKLYDEFSQYFSDLPFNRDEFVRVYPVQPLTVSFLDNLKNLFSQHRGIVDFIHYQIKGDEERSIVGILDKSCHTLVYSDSIFDHFRNVIRQTPEYNDYSQKVYAYYEKEVASIFRDEEDQIFALRIIKLLILAAISPVPIKLTVMDFAHHLMHRISVLDPKVNYQYVSGILGDLLSTGAFINIEGEQDDKNASYYIDLEVNINIIVKRRIEYLKGTLFDRDNRILTELGQYVDESYLPIKEFLNNPDAIRSIAWQKTERHGRLMFTDLTDVSYEKVDEIKEQLATGSCDFVFILLKPIDLNRQWQYLEDVIYPELSEDERGVITLWVPEPVDTGDSANKLREALVYKLLRNEYENDNSDTGNRVRKHLDSVLSDKIDFVKGVYRDAYWKGKIITVSGEEIVSPGEVGFSSFSETMEKCAGYMLSARYPKHRSIAPHSEAFTDNAFNKCIERFLKGEQTGDIKVQDFSAISIMENHMKPMKLVAGGQQRGYRLSLDIDKNPLVKETFTLMQGENTGLKDLYIDVKRGEYGISENSFKVLISTLVFSGLLTPYQNNRRMPLSQINAFNFWKIDSVGRGQLVDDNLQSIIEEISFIPPKFKKGVLTITRQHELWEYIKEFKRKWDKCSEDLVEKMRVVKDYEAFSNYKLPEMEKDIGEFKEFLDEIKVSYTSEQGLSRFLSAYQANPYLEIVFANISRLYEFLDNEMEGFLHIYNYVNHPGLKIPGNEKYADVYKMWQSLVKNLQSKDIIFDPDYYEKVKQTYQSFKDQYVTLYMEEHKNALSPENAREYDQIKGSEGYKTLNLLSQIELISVKDDLPKVNMQLSAVYQKMCNKLSRQNMVNSPVCSCGFTLGMHYQLIQPGSIIEMVERGIAQYIREIKSSRYRDKIEKHISSMKQVGKANLAHAILELLSINERTELRRATSLVNRNVIEELNKALTGQEIIVERNLGQLYDNLVNRTLSKSQVLKIVRNWLKEEELEGEDAYIRVVNKREYPKDYASNGNSNDDGPEQVFEPTSSKNGYEQNIYKQDDYDDTGFGEYLPPGFMNIIKDIIEERFPELSSYTKGHKDITILFLLSITGVWCDVYGLAHEQLWECVNDLETRYLEEVKEFGRHLLSMWPEIKVYYGEEKAEGIDDENRVDPGVIAEALLSKKNLIDDISSMLFDNGELKLTPIDILCDEFLFVFPLDEAVTRYLNLMDNKTTKVMQADLKKLTETKESVEAALEGGKMTWPRLPEVRVSDRLLQKKLEYIQLVTDTLDCMVKVNSTSMASEKADSLKDWIQVYRNNISLLNLKINECFERAKSMELMDLLPFALVSGQWIETIDRAQEKFMGKYDSVFNEGDVRSVSETLKGERVLTIDDVLTVKGKSLINDVGPERFYIILMDGMREDVWHCIKRRVLDRSELIYRVVEEGSLYSYFPSTTQVQIAALREFGYKGDIIPIDSESPISFYPENYLKYDNSNKLGQQQWDLLRINLIDDKIHRSNQELTSLMREIKEDISSYLLQFLKAMPKKSLILFIADHGFKFNPSYKSHDKDSSRYIHGEQSMEEVIVPWSAIYTL